MEKQKEVAWQGLWDRIEPILSKDWSAHLQMAGLTFLLLTIQIWQISGYGRLSLSVFLAGVVCLCEASSTAIRFKQNLQRQFQRNTIFLLALEILSVLFLLVNSRDIMSVIGIGGEVLLVFGLGSAIASQIVQLHCTEYRWRPGKDAVKEYLLIGALCLVIGFLLNIEIFNTWPRWDAFHYLRSFEELSVRNIFLPGEEGLRVCGHIDASYCLWLLLFDAIPGITKLNAMYLSNMALLSIAVVLFYGIFKYLHPDRHFFLNVLYSFACISSPLLFGLSADPSVELILAVGVLSLIYSIFIGNSISGIFSLYVVITSKETGVSVAATVVFVQLVYDVYRWYKAKKISDFSKLTYYFLCFGLGLSWLLQFLSGTWGSNGTISHITTQDGVAYNQFAFSAVHIKDTLIGSFLLNFNWIFSLLIIISICLFFCQLILKRTDFSAVFYKQVNVIISVALISYIFTMCMYVTFNNYRYYSASTMLLSILGLESLRYIVEVFCKKQVLKIGIPIILSCLLFVECYRPIDPITRMMYEGINTGKSVIVPFPQHSNVDMEPSFVDYAYSNRLVMYFDKALDKAFATIYNVSPLEETEILFSGEYQARIEDGRVTLGSLFCIWGFGYSYINPPRWGHWNAEGGYRYLSYEKEGNIDPSYVLGDTDLSGYLNDYEHIYYIKMPWGDTVLPALQERYPNISYFTTIDYRGWVLEIYQIK